MRRKKEHSRGSMEKNQQVNSQRNRSAQTDARRECGLPGGGAGRRDIVERIPGDIHVDPYITEGNPGYDESGSSEMISPERLASGQQKASPESQSKKS